MAVGHIVHAAQAQAVVEKGRADLVALGRELLHNPKGPIDAARKLGLPDPYAQARPGSRTASGNARRVGTTLGAIVARLEAD
jgi:2,4-dienoyl-CoA reductase-like NADH-dependent reductase (Old Yellow Enzyme family)